MQQLLAMLQQSDASALDSVSNVSNNISDQPSIAMLEQIEQQVNQFDFEQAAKTAAKLLHSLRQANSPD